MFVASRAPLNLPTLVEELPMVQRPPRSSASRSRSSASARPLCASNTAVDLYASTLCAKVAL
ncbi:Hypothetical protein ERS007731_04334 [Mycobacterium tuberculosis]|nr:Hypothetical protein ERS007731_04334 [Mycobacterium tuberculosis]